MAINAVEVREGTGPIGIAGDDDDIVLTKLREKAAFPSRLHYTFRGKFSEIHVVDSCGFIEQDTGYVFLPCYMLVAVLGRHWMPIDRWKCGWARKWSRLSRLNRRRGWNSSSRVRRVCKGFLLTVMLTVHVSLLRDWACVTSLHIFDSDSGKGERKVK